jgi:hypothetical protein
MASQSGRLYVIQGYSITNDNWQGKTSPHERRRIQNRLNQRAHRHRKKTSAVSFSQGTDSNPQDLNGICCHFSELCSSSSPTTSVAVERQPAAHRKGHVVALKAGTTAGVAAAPQRLCAPFSPTVSTLATETFHLGSDWVTTKAVTYCKFASLALMYPHADMAFQV